MFFNRDKDIDVDQLREQLIIDEGQVNEIYHDHLGYPTFGIGHLVIEGDPEYGMEVGTPVAEDRVVEVFAKDVETVIEENSRLQYSDAQNNLFNTHQITVVSINTDEGVLEPLGVGEILIEVQY